ncbi:hypothetical protein K1T71_013342 [Dendrolimus kikuchii]|uniref:Uncharacterized protein n=1 Tax=Dendrolimus kikuchii TaxID=765133 RepID=A0ACC1CHS2_9NEOP|nr:hypothetical protein K1T71_013342 [Dendrolimus kikuchii]
MTEEILAARSPVASTSSCQGSKSAKPEKYYQKCDNYKFEIYKYPEDVNAKIDIARKILKSCAENIRFSETASLDEISRFTGIKSKFEIAEYQNTLNRSLDYYFKSYIDSDNLVPTTSYKNFRQVIVESFLSRSEKLPSVYEVMFNSWKLLNTAKNNMLDVYNSEKVRMDMAIHGFVMECYPNTNKQFIIENPKNVMDRIFYLEKIIQYRASSRFIVYIETKIENTFIIVSPVSEIEQRFVKVFNQKDIEDAIMTCLIPFLQPNSVVVFDKDLRTSATKLPNEYASKKDMEKWLNSIGIPYNIGSLKAELYKLVMKYKNFAKEISYLEEVLTGCGHTVLWEPRSTNVYSFSGLLNLWYEKLKQHGYNDTALTEQFLDTVKNMPLDVWQTYNKLIAKQEIQCLSEDLVVAEVIDHIILAARNGCHSKPGLNLCDFKMPSKDPEFLKSIIVTNVQ